MRLRTCPRRRHLFVDNPPSACAFVVIPPLFAFGCRFAKPVPNAIHRTSLEKVAATAGERRKAIKKKTEEKYSPTHHFKLHETKPTVDKIRAEVEAARAAELKFEGIKAKPVRGGVACRCVRCRAAVADRRLPPYPSRVAAGTKTAQGRRGGEAEHRHGAAGRHAVQTKAGAGSATDQGVRVGAARQHRILPVANRNAAQRRRSATAGCGFAEGGNGRRGRGSQGCV